MPLLQTVSPHIHQPNSVAYLMKQVLYALLPGIGLYLFFFGWGIFLHLLLASLVALLTEAIMLWLRQRPIKAFLFDYSALVTAWLLVLAIPPLAPWWITALGVSFALVFAKHVYGGLGYNTFNPAMVGYAMLMISFPAEMTRWPLSPEFGGYLGFFDSLHVLLELPLGSGKTVDAYSGATLLDSVKISISQAYRLDEALRTPALGYLGSRVWEFVGLGYLVGGLYLIYRRVIDWHIPVAMLGALTLMASLFFLWDSDTYATPWFHLFSGAALLGAFFIATDPVSAATSRTGKLVYAAGIGVLVYVIRMWGSYPDSVAFSVLLMNMCAPMIDYYTQPPVFGADYDRQHTDKKPGRS